MGRARSVPDHQEVGPEAVRRAHDPLALIWHGKGGVPRAGPPIGLRGPVGVVDAVSSLESVLERIAALLPGERAVQTGGRRTNSEDQTHL